MVTQRASPWIGHLPWLITLMRQPRSCGVVARYLVVSATVFRRQAKEWTHYYADFGADHSPSRSW